MPTIFLSGLVVIILAATFAYDLGEKFLNWLAALSAINFDIITLLRNFTFTFNFLSLPMFKIFVGLTLSSISIFVMVQSYKTIKEKITNYGRTWTSLVTYLFIYGLFIALVWTKTLNK
ncbi:hypothetical protein HYX12_03065 [Candidatus Woesearchaeota archaeon]|nr:hypothetical protein [Candidatus Woesearchaeota archaeon]